MREKSHTWESEKATQRAGMWGGAPRCDFSHAPGSASDWPTAGTDSRCEGNRAPGREGRPHGGLGRGVGLRGATFLSHLEVQVTDRQRERTQGAREITHLEERDDKGYGEGVKNMKEMRKK